MRVINYILGFGAFAAAVVEAIFCAKVGSFGLACGDVRVAAAGWIGMIWFGALAIKIALWSTSGEIGGVSHGKSRNGEREACARA